MKALITTAIVTMLMTQVAHAGGTWDRVRNFFKYDEATDKCNVALLAPSANKKPQFDDVPDLEKLEKNPWGDSIVERSNVYRETWSKELYFPDNSNSPAFDIAPALLNVLKQGLYIFSKGDYIFTDGEKNLNPLYSRGSGLEGPIGRYLGSTKRLEISEYNTEQKLENLKGQWVVITQGKTIDRHVPNGRLWIPTQREFGKVLDFSVNKENKLAYLTLENGHGAPFTAHLSLAGEADLATLDYIPSRKEKLAETHFALSTEDLKARKVLLARLNGREFKVKYRTRAGVLESLDGKLVTYSFNTKETVEITLKDENGVDFKIPIESLEEIWVEKVDI